MLQVMLYHQLAGMVCSQKWYLQDVGIKPEIPKRDCCIYKYAIDFLNRDIRQNCCCIALLKEKHIFQLANTVFALKKNYP